MIDRRTVMLGMAAALVAPASEAGVVDWFNGARVGARLPEHDGIFVQGEWRADARLVLVDFWATWCAPCIAAIPKLNGIEQRFGAEGLQVIGVSDEPEAVVTPFIQRHGIDYAIVAGGKKPLRKSLKIRALPYAVMVDVERRIVWRGQPDALGDALIGKLLASATASA